MPQTKYRIYYDNGSAEDMESAKSCGVICIVQSEQGWHRQILSGYDYYFWDDVRWLGASTDTILDYLLARKPVQYLVRGRTVSDPEFARIMAKAHSECGGW